MGKNKDRKILLGGEFYKRMCEGETYRIIADAENISVSSVVKYIGLYRKENNIKERGRPNLIPLEKAALFYQLRQKGQSFYSIGREHRIGGQLVLHAVRRYAEQNGLTFENMRGFKVHKVRGIEDFTETTTGADSLGLPLVALKKDQCRYPYGDSKFTFCGHPVQHGSSFCPEHHKACFRKAPRLNEEEFVKL